MALSIQYAAKHTDHAGVTNAHIDHVVRKFNDRTGFFIATFSATSAGLSPLPCGLHGPSVGDTPVNEAECAFVKRGERKGASRLCNRPMRDSDMITVIAGPGEGQECVLYAIFGGPPAPREPWDDSMNEAEKAESVAFWREHALSF